MSYTTSPHDVKREAVGPLVDDAVAFLGAAPPVPARHLLRWMERHFPDVAGRPGWALSASALAAGGGASPDFVALACVLRVVASDTWSDGEKAAAIYDLAVADAGRA
jgi:hypothetical protein